MDLLDAAWPLVLRGELDESGPSISLAGLFKGEERRLRELLSGAANANEESLDVNCVVGMIAASSGASSTSAKVESSVSSSDFSGPPKAFDVIRKPSRNYYRGGKSWERWFSLSSSRRTEKS